MGERLYRKKGTAKFVGIYVYSFWAARDHPREKDAKKLQEELEAFMKSKGYLRC